jgi:nucleosome binding factor SPN SPT16 subunit
MVDVRRSSIILPINGFAVPFHINTLKSVMKQEEGDYTVLRFMFSTPGLAGKEKDTVSYPRWASIMGYGQTNHILIAAGL